MPRRRALPALAALVSLTAGGGQPAPPHAHRATDVAVRVVDGEVLITVTAGGQATTDGPTAGTP